MKSLDERISEITSPFEDNEQDQSDITEIAFLNYRKDSLIEAIGKKTGYQEFDLFLDEVLEELDSGDTILFLTDCILKLQTVYPLDVMVDHIHIENFLENDPDGIIDLIKFFVYNKWMDSIIPYMNAIEIKDLKDKKFIILKVKEAYFRTQEEIIKDTSIHPLIRYYFKYCTYSDGIKILTIFVFKDIPGVVSKQLVLNN